jgi:hypothetical protein
MVDLYRDCFAVCHRAVVWWLVVVAISLSLSLSLTLSPLSVNFYETSTFEKRERERKC